MGEARRENGGCEHGWQRKDRAELGLRFIEAERDWSGRYWVAAFMATDGHFRQQLEEERRGGDLMTGCEWRKREGRELRCERRRRQMGVVHRSVIQRGEEAWERATRLGRQLGRLLGRKASARGSDRGVGPASQWAGWPGYSFFFSFSFSKHFQNKLLFKLK